MAHRLLDVIEAQGGEPSPVVVSTGRILGAEIRRLRDAIGARADRRFNPRE